MATNAYVTRLRHHPAMIGWVSVLITLCIWSGFSLIARAGAVYQFSSWDLGAMRCTVGVLIALPVLLITHKLNTIFSWHMLKLSLSGGLGYFIFVFWGFELAPTAHTAIWLYGAIPFWTVLMSAVLLHSQPTRHEQLSLACLMIGIAGLLWVNYDRHIPFNWGDLCFLAAAAFWGYFSILLKQQSYPLITLVGGISFYSSLIYLPIYLLFLPKYIAQQPWSDVLLHSFFHGVVVLFIALWFYNKALGELGATRTNTVLALAPFIAAVLAVYLLQESLGLDTIIGLVAASIAVFQPWRLIWRD